jgi:aminomethyltransferase
LVIRHSAALFDLSPFPKYYVCGREALAFLNHLCPRNFTKVKNNQVAYTAWCDPDGKVRQEGTVFRFAEDAYAIYSGEPDLEWFQQVAVGYDVEIEDRSESKATLALQGPYSAQILQSISDIDFARLPYFGIARGRIADVPCVVSRTGFTGDLGYEIWLAADSAVRVWDAILAVGRDFDARPCGLLALDIARVEAGFILANANYPSALIMGELMVRGDFCRSTDAVVDEQKVSPYEIRMGWTVDLSKSDFIGRQALAEEKRLGVKRQFVGIEIDRDAYEQLYADSGLQPDYPPRVAQWVVPLYAPHGGRQIGHITSRVWSPYLGKYIAVGFVETELATPGTLAEMECTVMFEQRRTPCRVAETPFFPSDRMRAANPLDVAESFTVKQELAIAVQ